MLCGYGVATMHAAKVGQAQNEASRYYALHTYLPLPNEMHSEQPQQRIARVPQCCTPASESLDGYTSHGLSEDVCLLLLAIRGLTGQEHGLNLRSRSHSSIEFGTMPRGTFLFSASR